MFSSHQCCLRNLSIRKINPLKFQRIGGAGYVYKLYRLVFGIHAQITKYETNILNVYASKNWKKYLRVDVGSGVGAQQK